PVLTPLQEQMTGSSRSSLLMRLAAVGAVLLIASVNIASLMLIRATGRRRELAIRSALGASAARLFRQMLIDSLALSAAGGFHGVALAYWILPVVVVNAPVNLPRLSEIHIDARVLGFALLLSIVTGLLAGILPAWKFAH